jgi:chromosome partitioning protein
MPHQRGKVLAVLNMKGGVGKTTISAHVIRVLYHRRKLKTLLIDLDPQFNLTQCLMARSTYERIKADGRTILAAFEPMSDIGLFDVATTNDAPPQPSDISHNLRYFTGRIAFLDLIPGHFDLIKYSIVSDRRKLDHAQERFLRFVSNAKLSHDLVVIDCNPSSSFITLCALQACTNLLVPVRPDRYSVLGLELVADLLDRIPTIHPKPRITILINGVPAQNYNRRIEDELRAHNVFGQNVLTHRLRISKLLQADPDYTGFATDKPVPYKDLLRTEISLLTDELSHNLGLAA